jgi:membrane fusion protein
VSVNGLSRTGFEPDPPFLETSPPHWVARGLSTIFIALFVVALAAAAIVPVPETVAGPFVLVPERGADPVRSAREGTIADVRVVEGQSVAKGATMFIIRSQSVGDRSAEMRSLDMQMRGAEQRMANAKSEYTSQRRADDLEAKRLETRLASLDRMSALKRKQLETTREMAARFKRGEQQGIVPGLDAEQLVLEANRLETEVEAAVSDQDDTRAGLAKLRQDTTTRSVQYRELVRSLEQEHDVARVRLESMRGQAMGAGGDLVVTAPCGGAVLRMMVSTPGAVVQAGDALGEVACAGERLQVELSLAQQAVARVREGQGAKLLYDAFPYQRFGVKFGRVRWVGPASALPVSGAQDSPAAGSRAFRALIDGDDSTIMVGGEPRPLLVGMRGSARVVVGQRSLISFAFEPLRALRENFASVPQATPPPNRGPKS